MVDVHMILRQAPCPVLPIHQNLPLGAKGTRYSHLFEENLGISSTRNCKRCILLL